MDILLDIDYDLPHGFVGSFRSSCGRSAAGDLSSVSSGRQLKTRGTTAAEEYLAFLRRFAVLDGPAALDSWQTCAHKQYEKHDAGEPISLAGENQTRDCRARLRSDGVGCF
jgi:hypothetical protein